MMPRKDTPQGRVIQEAFGMVVARMGLRPPQAAALEQVRDLLLRLPRPLSQCDAHEVREFLTFDTHRHANHPSFLLSLATGVGKTRLAGAIMALLWLSGEAEHFLFLAPSRAVLTRLRSAFNPSFREYIFIERNLVPEPTLVVADQLEDPVATGRQNTMFGGGPTVYLLTHQLITTSARFRKSGNEYSGQSPADFLRSKPDLVVISDEAHHIDESDDEQAAWPRAISDLQPRLHLGLTATVPKDTKGEVRSWVNLLCEYKLQQALKDELYTKRVEMLVRHFPEDIEAAEVDVATIRYALQRLDGKRDALAAAQGPPPFPQVKPVLVFFTEDTAHATRVAELLRADFGVPDAELLVTHSKKSKTVEEAELLLGIEDPANPVRIVVNVKELVEGWDVTNVYVIAPLRAMASFAFGVQAMGRGLRLPAGRRVENSQLDTLDVVCFGRSTLEQIIERETRWAERTPLIEVGGWDRPEVVSVVVASELQRSETIHFRAVDLVTPELKVKFGPTAFSSIRAMIVSSLRLAAAGARVGAAGGRVAFTRRVFVDAVATEVVKRMPRHLSDDLHLGALKAEVERWLREETREGETVQFNPLEVAALMVSALNATAGLEDGNYRQTGAASSVTFPLFSITFDIPKPQDGSVVLTPRFEDVPALGDRDSFRLRRPYRGWNRSLHTLYTFDSWHEAKTAQLLDRSSVSWWVRNQPRRFRIETPAGMLHPDFIAQFIDGDGGLEVLLLEVKGDTFWLPPDSLARRKAKAAQKWVSEQHGTPGVLWTYGIAMESVVDAVASWEELRDRLVLE